MNQQKGENDPRKNTSWSVSMKKMLLDPACIWLSHRGWPCLHKQDQNQKAPADWMDARVYLAIYLSVCMPCYIFSWHSLYICTNWSTSTAWISLVTLKLDKNIAWIISITFCSVWKKISSGCLFCIISTKIWAVVRKIVSADVHPVGTQISLCICTVWSKSLMSAWRNFATLATRNVPSEDFDQSAWMCRLIYYIGTHWKVRFLKLQLIYFFLTLLLLNTTCAVLANSVDPNQLTFEEANWSGSALFDIKFVHFYQKPASSNLTG